MSDAKTKSRDDDELGDDDVREINEDDLDARSGPVLDPTEHKSLIPWIEKYRPRRLNEVSHQDHAVSALRRVVTSGQLPHMLFYGPPGTGKTSTALALARELWGPELMRSRVLEMNASNERGIDVIRAKVKTFAQIAVGRETVSGYPCPPFKLIILDEADSMTRDAQSALRRTMEQHTRVTRFAIICNYVSRIIDPITSRCAKYRFQPLPAESLTKRLSHIAVEEKIKADSKIMSELVRVSEGDLRKAITTMQTAARMVDTDEPLSLAHVDEVAGIVPATVLDGLLAAVKSQEFKAIHSAANECVLSAYPVNQVLSQLQTLVITSTDMTDEQKAAVCIRIAESDKKLIDGADEFLQLMDVLSTLSTAIHI